MSAATCLGGTLRRDQAGWRWSDGAIAPVQDLTLQDLAPNFRCATFGGDCYVEIPRRWRSAGLWPRGVVDLDAAAAIAELLGGRPSRRIYAEGLCELRDDHRLTRDGWLVPAAEWDAAIAEGAE